uniref:protein CutA homolog isoform X1 n=2 Tax=Pristiophorus japonicus TaxID=55135 RepID=UPI00398F2407
MFVLLFTLLMFSGLRSVGLRLFSMATETYVSGTHSAAFITCPNMDVAKDIARGVVKKKLAACVNIIPQITSVYEWKGNIEEDSEVLLVSSPVRSGGGYQPTDRPGKPTLHEMAERGGAGINSRAFEWQRRGSFASAVAAGDRLSSNPIFF